MMNEKAISIIKNAFSWYEDNARESEEEDWSGQHEALDLAIKALKQQPSEDCISREAVQDLISRWLSDYLLDETREALETINYKVGDMPSVTPQYTDEEIDKAQAVEQAYVDKMVELAVEESRKKWLNSFDTSSATKCFEAVNLLKQRLEGEE